jgi:hypothetical protein
MHCSKALAYRRGNVVGSEDPEDRPAFIADSDGDEASYAMASQLRNRGQGLLRGANGPRFARREVT